MDQHIAEITYERPAERQSDTESCTKVHLNERSGETSTERCSIGPSLVSSGTVFLPISTMCPYFKANIPGERGGGGGDVCGVRRGFNSRSTNYPPSLPQNQKSATRAIVVLKTLPQSSSILSTTPVTSFQPIHTPSPEQYVGPLSDEFPIGTGSENRPTRQCNARTNAHRRLVVFFLFLFRFRGIVLLVFFCGIFDVGNQKR